MDTAPALNPRKLLILCYSECARYAPFADSLYKIMYRVGVAPRTDTIPASASADPRDGPPDSRFSGHFQHLVAPIALQED